MTTLTALHPHMSTTLVTACAGLLAVAALPGCDVDDTGKLAEYEAAAAQVEEHLETFDELDFDVFSNQKWDLLHHSHSPDVVVHWPDGRVTQGIEVHIEDLKGLFVYAPDTRIKVHPIRFGSGEWTSVTGIFEGTFTEPMPNADGTMTPPTGKPFKLTMNTVGRWENGVMVEEFLFWDNLTYLRQIGLLP